MAFTSSKTVFLAVAFHHPLEASASVIHNGVQFPSLSFCQPHSEGLGRDGSAIMACPQTWPAWNDACLACCRSAALEGGMFSAYDCRKKRVVSLLHSL